MIYDIDGNPVEGGNVKDAFMELVASGEINLGSAVGATLVYNGLADAWIANGETAYNAMKESYKTLANKAIPFFISTDQHGRGVEQHRWANNIDVDGINFLNINLGDTVQSTFGHYALGNMLARSKQVKNYIGVVGNHDVIAGSSDIPTIYDLTRYFMSTYSRIVPCGFNDSYTIIDGLHDVKIIVSDNYIHNADGTYINDALSGEYCDWLISELAKDDYDIVFVQHWMIYALRGVYTYRDGTPQSTDGIGGPQELRTILTARKNKTSGTITDTDGVSHVFDFTNCEHDLLCCLHGHQHEEIMATLDNLLCYVADWYGNAHSCVFGIIDRENDKLRIWKFDDSTVLAELVLSL